MTPSKSAANVEIYQRKHHSPGVDGIKYPFQPSCPSCTCYDYRMRLGYTTAGSLFGTCYGRVNRLPTPFRQNPRWLSYTPRYLAEPNYDGARKWQAQLGARPITDEIGEVSYARSSGPGGQNVNKVNSKAQLRIPLEQLLPMLPEVLHEGIRTSRYHAEKTNTLLIQCDESRKQVANKDTCYRRLNELIMDVYHQAVPGETSVEQKEKVKKLQRAENESRLKMKKKHSSKKAARRGDD